jgi:hypothetical protein
MAKPQTGFAFHVSSGHLARINGEVDDHMLGQLAYVVECIPETDLVVCVTAGMVFTPGSAESDWLSLYRDGTTQVPDTDPRPSLDIVAWLARTNGSGFRMMRRGAIGDASHTIG